MYVPLGRLLNVSNAKQIMSTRTISIGLCSRRLNPRSAPRGRAEAVATRPDVLPIEIVAHSIRWNTDTETADSCDGLRRSNDDLLKTLGRDAANQSLLAVCVEGALGEGIVVWCVNDVDGDIVVCVLNRLALDLTLSKIRTVGRGGTDLLDTPAHRRGSSSRRMQGHRGRLGGLSEGHRDLRADGIGTGG